jgi:hypothetical protein
MELAGNQLLLSGFLLERERPMKEKTVKDHEGKKHPADTAGPGGAAYAPHDEGAEKLAAESTGDNRTPDKTIGEIKYAKKPEQEHKEPTGGAGEPQTSQLEPEKHGGISGP